MHRSVTVKPKEPVVFLDFESLDCGDLDLSSLEAVTPGLVCYPSTPSSDLASRALSAWCVIVNKVVLDRTFFAARAHLRLVCIAATGTNNVDLEAAADHGVTVVNCRGYGTTSLGQHVLMLMLVLARRLPRYLDDVAAGRWVRARHFCLLNHPIQELGGRRLGLVGYGAIAREVERLATALGMEVVIAERRGQMPRKGRIDHETVLETADVLSLHCPLTPETASLIDAGALRRMRREALLINTARGGLIDDHALVEALRDGEITAAAVDVLETEPPPAEQPLLAAGLSNLLITPHCAWGSLDARQRVVEQTAENIRGWRAGSTIRQVGT